MAIEELITAVPPPSSPVDVGPLDRRTEIEVALGTALPDDLFALATTYGSGRFPGGIEVFNPFSEKYLEKVTLVAECYQALKAAEGGDFVPYDMFPSPQGYLPWGESWAGFVFCWQTVGSPAEWPTVLLVGRQPDTFELVRVQMTAFLAKAFSQPMNCVLWDVEWQKENLIGKSFEPEQR